jgi:5-formyltetrahydrofolate cyclo-ligase
MGNFGQNALKNSQKSKAELRKYLLNQRRQISHQIWQQKSQDLCDRLSNLSIFQQAQNILAFTSYKQEPDLSYLWQRFSEKDWGFSRCLEKDLIWHQVDVTNFERNMRAGAFGIVEPLYHLPLMDLESIDLILIPAIACDRQGYRLGYGGGFYDRWLPNSRGIKAGVIFDEFYLEEIAHDIWDVPLEVIITETIWNPHPPTPSPAGEGE